MLDIFMIVMTVILAVVLIVMNIYLLAYYCHPDDRGFGSAFICKCVVVLGMTLSWAQVLMLPLDVSNARGEGGDIRMDLFWIIIYLCTAVFVLFIIPALTSYYEADPEWTCCEKIKYSFCFLFATIIIVIAILIVTYAFLSTAEIPIMAINCSIVNLQSSPLAVSTNASECLSTETTLNVEVSFPIYVIALMSFISWFLFVLFGGIGLPALPLDFIYDFCTRPKKITGRDLDTLREKVANRAKAIKEIANECKELETGSEVMKKGFWNKEKRHYNDLMRKLRAGVAVLDKEFNLILIQEDLNDAWVCQYYFGLVLGVFCLLISLAWILHILLYFIIIPGGQPIYPFLNNLLSALVESNVSFVATAFFALFCLYLLWATIKGNVKFGLRILLCWAIHPMKKNETYMNSFLFNVGLILLSSVSVTQFCAASFRDYVNMTDIELIFSTQIRYMKFFVYFYKYHIFEYILFGVSILSTFYLLCRPSDINSVDKIYEKKEEEMKLKGNSDSNISSRDKIV